jgi:HEAT repeat protein
VAPLLLDEKLSHMARVVLERIPGPAAARALCGSLSKAANPLKVGIVNSLAVRGDREAIPLLTPLLKDADMQVAGSAAQALGKLGATEALPALAEFRKRAPKELGVLIADAYLDIAERLRAEGKRREAIAIYRELMADENKLVRLTVLRSTLGRLRQRDDERKLRMLERILERARDIEGKKMVLRVLGGMGDPGALTLAASALDDAGTAPDAVAALLRIAGKLHQSSPERAVAALERVLAGLKDEELRKQVESQLQAWKEK